MWDIVVNDSNTRSLVGGWTLMRQVVGHVLAEFHNLALKHVKHGQGGRQWQWTIVGDKETNQKFIWEWGGDWGRKQRGLTCVKHEWGWRSREGKALHTLKHEQGWRREWIQSLTQFKKAENSKSDDVIYYYYVSYNLTLLHPPLLTLVNNACEALPLLCSWSQTVRATLRWGHLYTKILQDRGEPNRCDTDTVVILSSIAYTWK